MTTSSTTRRINFLRNQGIPLLKARRALSEANAGTRWYQPLVFLSGVTHPLGVGAQTIAVRDHHPDAADYIAVERLHNTTVVGRPGESRDAYVFDLARQIVLARPDTEVTVWSGLRDDLPNNRLLRQLPATIYAFDSDELRQMAVMRTGSALFAEAFVTVESETTTGTPQLLIVDIGEANAQVTGALRELGRIANLPGTTGLDIITVTSAPPDDDVASTVITLRNDGRVSITGRTTAQFPFPDGLIERTGSSRRPTSIVVDAVQDPHPRPTRAGEEVTDFAVGTTLAERGSTLWADIGRTGHLLISTGFSSRDADLTDVVVSQALSKALPWQPGQTWQVFVTPLGVSTPPEWREVVEQRWSGRSGVVVGVEADQLQTLLHEQTLRVSGTGAASWVRADPAALAAADFAPAMVVVLDVAILDEATRRVLGDIERTGRSAGVHIVTNGARTTPQYALTITGGHALGMRPVVDQWVMRLNNDVAGTEKAFTCFSAEPRSHTH